MSLETISVYLCFDGSLLFISYKPEYPDNIRDRLSKRRPANVRSSIESMLTTALANPFDYWVTISFAKDDYGEVEEFRRWRTKRYPDLQFVEVAVQNPKDENAPRPTDDCWHIHMLVSGIPLEDLKPKFSIVPHSKAAKASTAVQEYRWEAVRAHFNGRPKMTEVQGLRSATFDGAAVEQAGKAIYMAKQFDSASSAVFRPGRRLFNASTGLVKTLPRIGYGTISTGARVKFFEHNMVPAAGKKRVFPFGWPGDFGAYASTAGGSADWGAAMLTVKKEYRSTEFSSPALVLPGDPF